MRNSIALATFIVAFGFILSRFLGVIRQVVITSAFGMESAELAAVFVAFRNSWAARCSIHELNVPLKCRIQVRFF